MGAALDLNCCAALYSAIGAIAGLDCRGSSNARTARDRFLLRRQVQWCQECSTRGSHLSFTLWCQCCKHRPLALPLVQNRSACHPCRRRLLLLSCGGGGTDTLASILHKLESPCASSAGRSLPGHEWSFGLRCVIVIAGSVADNRGGVDCGSGGSSGGRGSAGSGGGGSGYGGGDCGGGVGSASSGGLTAFADQFVLL
eukprot:NODE_17105_length_961_cov_7.206235.p1 GENE.NODE_17105_length_961_cov_7.206235~~NODE_17105_length_961_cov_7.206235.p1  ORF type:complete len:198 (-),score=32.06 NODE_17105_length_961_cov_7.206235:59-652(-)